MKTRLTVDARVAARLPVALVAAMLAVGLFAATADAKKPVPTISLDSAVLSGYLSNGQTYCTFGLAYTVNGLKGNPSWQWTVYASDGSVAADIGTVTKADNGVPSSDAYPVQLYFPNFAYPFDGALHTFTLFLRDAGNSVVATSNSATRDCPSS